jgi:hypothetical protein
MYTSSIALESGCELHVGSMVGVSVVHLFPFLSQKNYYSLLHFMFLPPSLSLSYLQGKDTIPIKVKVLGHSL